MILTAYWNWHHVHSHWFCEHIFLGGTILKFRNQQLYACKQKEIKLFMVHYFLGSSRCLIYKICSCHDIAEILLKLALNTNQSINHVLLSEVM
jgi:hypothetical protein